MYQDRAPLSPDPPKRCTESEPKPDNRTDVRKPGHEAKPNQPVPLGEQLTMNYNLHLTQNSSRPHALEFQVADRGGAQAEPYMSVRSAHVQPRNLRTGNGPKGLAIPATVCETPNVPPEAEDIANPGRGSGGDDETDPLRSFLIRMEDDPNDKSDENESEDKNEGTSISSNEDNPPNLVPNHQKRGRANGPKSRPGITIASLNMRGCQRTEKTK